MAQVLDWCTTLHIRLKVDWNPAVPLARMELSDPIQSGHLLTARGKKKKGEEEEVRFPITSGRSDSMARKTQRWHFGKIIIYEVVLLQSQYLPISSVFGGATVPFRNRHCGTFVK